MQIKKNYQLSKEEVISRLQTSFSGLKKEAIPALQKEYGKNVLAEAKQKSKLSILLGQFNDVMIIILIIAAAISFIMGEHTDAFVIIAIIIGNAWMGYSQESKAEASIKMLKKMAAQFALVLRNDRPVKLEAAELLPGDVILLEAGSIIPADARLIEVSAFKTDEASLTGESFSIEKITDAIDEDNLVPGDQRNMIFKGTIVSNGSAKAVVTATGMNTEIGKIAGLMDTGFQKTPLQKRLAVFSKQLSVIIIIICVLVFVLGLQRGTPAFEMFLTALSLAVAALPEALPVVITIALARSAARMVKEKALIRKLPAVETLGSVTYICTDKTGTLTQNIMTVEKLQSADNKEELLNYAMLLNNEVKFSDKDELLGDSTETALVTYALKENYTKADADAKYPLVATLPFDSERMRMSSLHKNENKWILFTKGAPVKIAEVLNERDRNKAEEWLRINREWANQGLRVLFFSYKIFEQQPAKHEMSLESDLELLGMTGMIDPPREEVADAILQCKTAGIKTVMITGDQALTAKAIGKRLEIIDKDGAAVTGADLQKLSEEELQSEAEKVFVYARVSPEQKLNIVKALQHNGEFVAMTGDGVNDAPSLKQADIGLAMGITGTDVAKEASDMILLDDNFATIVKAVKEGRRIYENIRKFILYVLSCNLSEILTLLVAPLLGFAIPLLPIHILWINLVTDGLPGIELVAEPAEDGIMKQPPRPPKENLFAGGFAMKIIWSGIVLTLAALFIQWWAVGKGYDVNTQQTMVFTTLCFVQLANALSCRSFHHSLFAKGIFSNKAMWITIIITIILQLLLVYLPFLHPIFKTTSLSQEALIMILLVAIISLLCIELLKFIDNKTRKI